MSEDFFDELLKKKSDDLDSILDKIRNRWDTDLTRDMWDDTWMPPREQERDETTPERDLPKRANRSRKNKQRHRRRK